MDEVVDKSEAVSDYDNPEPVAPEAKKAKLEHRTEYDLKWLEQLHAVAQQEVTHDDLFTFLQSYEGECLHIELDLTELQEPERRSQLSTGSGHVLDQEAELLRGLAQGSGT